MRESKIHTPCYIVQERALKENLEQLAGLARETGCRILLAQKAFSMFRVYPLIGNYLAGTTASGLYEARLGAECMGKENHIFSPAYREEEMGEILSLCGHVVLNSPQQIRRYKRKILAAGRSVGLRVNPECSTQEGHAIYDPCAPGSRLGTTLSQLERALADTPDLLEGIEGLHFHTLCEQDADALAVTLDAVVEKFGVYMTKMKWVNLGGGHHITRPGYHMETLKQCIRRVQKLCGGTVYLEPGEAVALQAGTLRTSVLEITENGVQTAILDASAACHMPDVLEMPYRPPLSGAGLPGEKPFTYRLAGPTCLAGDVIGDYSFDRPLETGDVLEFQDMAIYSMVKNNTFNGMALPDIVLEREDGSRELVRRFGYEDFKGRLS
ncbi:carboxynorspermidine decarboxylase [Lachnospiraceae bacterium DSM 108991]|uniref:Carboxynorspermidine decarboxylase n=1 Tax=Claveliimonas monacensis TaxID=2779351 RepID=A0ABR9RI43_9FIRM|nr:carboxynorspermidine decarboxylase [Claveliimonas monacensis]MBE5062641.1 carboxynorspermidine decarboxylase [Claveliimonas monacensis]